MSTNKKSIALKTTGFAVLLTGFALMSYFEDEPQPLVHAEVVQTNEPIRQETQTVGPQKASSHKQTAAIMPEPENPFFEKEVKARLVQVHDQFAEDIKYPEFSQPIWNEEELRMYTPNRSSGMSITTDFDDASAPQISLVPVKHRFMNREAIVANAEITNIEPGRYTTISARLVANKNVVASTKAVQTDDAGEYQYLIQFDDLTDWSEINAQSLMIIAEYNIDGEHYELAAPIAYEETVATLESVGDAYVDGEYLEVPVNISTTVPGYHKISGNLYDAESGKALIHLSGKNALNSHDGVITLRAHISALKAMGQEGPYELKDISFIRMPSEPRFYTENGMVPEDSYAVAGFPFGQYEDVPYHNEKAQQRLEFLARIGGTN